MNTKPPRMIQSHHLGKIWPSQSAKNKNNASPRLKKITQTNYKKLSNSTVQSHYYIYGKSQFKIFLICKYKSPTSIKRKLKMIKAFDSRNNWNWLRQCCFNQSTCLVFLHRRSNACFRQNVFIWFWKFSNVSHQKCSNGWCCAAKPECKTKEVPESEDLELKEDGVLANVVFCWILGQ